VASEHNNTRATLRDPPQSDGAGVELIGLCADFEAAERRMRAIGNSPGRSTDDWPKRGGRPNGRSVPQPRRRGRPSRERQ
jgi:hypothetical protein